MKGDRFDQLTQAVAGAGALPGTRRALLRALGLGGLAFPLGRALAAESRIAPPVDSATPPVDPIVEPQDPPAPSPIEDLAFELEYDVAQMFQFVRDKVAYDPYPGMMRGAKGTLWGLAGNSVDQAMLLTELLGAGQTPTRLVAGELTEAAAASLLAAGVLTPEAAGARAKSLFAPSADEAVATPAALTPEQEAFVGAFPAFVERVLAVIDGHAGEGIATVTGALAQAGITLPAPAPAVPELERQRHVWLQYAEGPNWVDLDPSMPGAKPGDVFAANPTPLEALPDDLVHRVSFRLIAEQVAEGGVVRNELLTFEAPSSELLGVPVTLLHPQPEAMDRVGVAIGGLIDGFRNFVPSLLVGEQSVFGTPVTFGTGGGVIDVFGGGAAAGDTLAEWLEVTVTTPTGAVTATRTVFDRVGEEARTAGPVDPAKVAPVDLVDAGDPESSFLPLAGLWSFAVTVGDVPERLAARTVPENLKVDDLLPALHAYHYARGVEALRTPMLSGVRLYADAPNVTAFVLRPTAAGTAGRTAGVGLDLLHRSVAASGAGPGGVHPLVAAGALAHAVEQAMFETAGTPPLNLPVTSASGVVRVFAEAKARGVATLVLAPGGARTAPPKLAAEPTRLVEAALAAGQVVIIPERPVRLGGRDRTGWWLVDPATGATRDQMDDGGGSTMTEYAFVLIKIAACITMFAGLGAATGGVFRGVANLVTGGSDSAIIAGAAAAGLGAAAGVAGADACLA